MREEFRIYDGGVSGLFTCKCGKKMKIEVWGLVWMRDKKGKRLGQKLHDWKNMRKCKCGKKWLFIAMPDVYWKDVTNLKKEKE